MSATAEPSSSHLQRQRRAPSNATGNDGRRPCYSGGGVRHGDVGRCHGPTATAGGEAAPPAAVRPRHCPSAAAPTEQSHRHRCSLLSAVFNTKRRWCQCRDGEQRRRQRQRQLVRHCCPAAVFHRGRHHNNTASNDGAGHHEGACERASGRPRGSRIRSTDDTNENGRAVRPPHGPGGGNRQWVWHRR